MNNWGLLFDNRKLIFESRMCSEPVMVDFVD